MNEEHQQDLWNSLHDATLLSLSLNWEDGAVSVTLHKHPEGRVIIFSQGAVRVLCPRSQPWGRSVSVNAVRRVHTTDGEFERVEIEMQSGDLIELDAKGFSLVVADDQTHPMR